MSVHAVTTAIFIAASHVVAVSTGAQTGLVTKCSTRSSHHAGFVLGFLHGSAPARRRYQGFSSREHTSRLAATSYRVSYRNLHCRSDACFTMRSHDASFSDKTISPHPRRSSRIEKNVQKTVSSTTYASSAKRRDLTSREGGKNDDGHDHGHGHDDTARTNTFDSSLASAVHVGLIAQVAAVVAVVVACVDLVPSDALAADSSLTLAQATASVDFGAVFAKAGKASIGGGISGAAAAVVQVLSLMWLRTAMNFQYRNGGSTQKALETLWQEGGISRLYRGVSFALVQSPLSRFGDTAANVGVLALLEAFEETRGLPLPLKSAAGSLAAGMWRIGLTPIDTYKTTLQVSGADGVSILAEKVAANGPSVLFEGALATATATFVGHYPWYFTYNSLGAWLPTAPPGEPLLKLGRQALLGLCASCVSDCCSNSVRVVKTTKQTAPKPISYPDAVKEVVDEDGVTGLFFRGLQTRLLVNALQGALFAVAWKYFEGVFKTGLY